jgi:hypothetical protein
MVVCSPQLIIRIGEHTQTGNFVTARASLSRMDTKVRPSNLTSPLLVPIQVSPSAD